MANSKICKIDGCGKPHWQRGWCNGHYKRWYRYGTPFGEGTATFFNKALDFHVYETYRIHKNGAKARKIEWLFTYALWFKKWVDSGHWHERGSDNDQYCMARKGDKGPYSFDNVNIKTFEENLRERKCSENQKRTIGLARQGEKNSSSFLTEEIIINIRNEYDKNPKRGMNIFLAKKYNLRPQHINKIVKRQIWRHI